MRYQLGFVFRVQFRRIVIIHGTRHFCFFSMYVPMSDLGEIYAARSQCIPTLKS